MVAAKRQQTSTILYTLITFIALFIISITFAVVYYVKFEEQRKIATEAKENLDSVASEAQMRRGLAQIIGSIPPRTSGLQVMVDFLDQMVTTIIGGPVSDISAELKVESVKSKVNDALRPLYGSYLDSSFNDPNSTGLVRIIDLIRIRLENTQSSLLDLQDRYTQLNNQFNDAISTFAQTEQRLNSEVEQYKQQADETLAKYAYLEDLFRQTAEQQVQNLRDDLKAANTENENLRDELLKKDAELELTKQMMKRAQAEIEGIKPLPDSNAPAYVPDGKIILVDTQTGIVHINIGSNDKVYPGLTFAVYDKNLPIPKTGEGKAEIEVFDVGQTISAARITTAIDPRNPIIQDDIIANLIWDTKKVNTFVVAGDFEYGDAEKIKELIEKWGGNVDQSITIETDYVVLGRPPRVEPRPSAEDMGIYPTALEKYEKSKKRYEEYQKILTQAQSLSIPIFNTERFLYFTGYKEKAGRAGAF
jgi:hypothetical protein